MPETRSPFDARVCQLHWSTTCILPGGYCDPNAEPPAGFWPDDELDGDDR